jgi:hypothetical protein
MDNSRKSFKLGRLARSYDKRIPMLHTLMARHGAAAGGAGGGLYARNASKPWDDAERHPRGLHMCRLLSRHPGLDLQRPPEYRH